MIGRRAVDAAHAWKTLAGLDEPAEVLLADVRQRFFAPGGYRRASDTRAVRPAGSPGSS